MLEALRDAETPVSIVTKSTLVLRDLDLLVRLSEGPGVTVYFTITTLDPALCSAVLDELVGTRFLVRTGSNAFTRVDA